MSKTALVTGAGARIGQALALYLAGRGYDVAVHYNSSRAGADETVAEIEKLGQRGVALQADLLSEAETQGLGPAAVEALGAPLNVLVNSASIFENDHIDTATRESWDRHMGSNLRAPFVLTQFLGGQAPDPITDENGEPQAEALVVNIVDQRVRKLHPEFMTYTIAKMGLWAFTRTAAQALGPRVRVNAIGPGPTIQGHRQSIEHFTNERNSTILERGSNPSDIAAALGFLIDARAVTGQLICVDGGQHLIYETPDVLGPV
jgi:NAD(P)-dependent dehydrogenase (short-subunit alcohol dehydrogenase family)